MSGRPVVVGLMLAMVCRVAASQETGPIGFADYPVIAASLREPVPDHVDIVRFEDLWRDPDGSKGRAVRVTGIARRAFRQPAVGDFPALVELWLTDDVGNPIGLLFPDGSPLDLLGRQVAFSGRVLRLVDYRDREGTRRAPLIVGPSPPTIAPEAPIRPHDAGRSRTEWVIALALLVFVALVLGVQHARRPRNRPRPPGPRPQFETPADRMPEDADG